MENASKALLIAGGVLLAMMIITIGVVLHNSFSNTTDQYSKRMSATELTEFNTKFEVFKERTNITAQEIASLVNITRENNEYFNVNVKVFDSSNPDDIDSNKNIKEDKIISFIQNNSNLEFSCSQIGYDTNGQVNLITFTKTAEKSNVMALTILKKLDKKPTMKIIIEESTYDVKEGETWQYIVENKEITLKGAFYCEKCPICKSSAASKYVKYIVWDLKIEDNKLCMAPRVGDIETVCACDDNAILSSVGKDATLNVYKAGGSIVYASDIPKNGEYYYSHRFGDKYVR